MRTRLACLLLATALAAAAAPSLPAVADAPSIRARVVHDGLQVPWDVAFAPDGKMLVTERPGRIRVYASHRIGAPLLNSHTISKVRAEGEAGVMGLAVAAKRGETYVWVCASRTYDGAWRNQVLRYTLDPSGDLTSTAT